MHLWAEVLAAWLSASVARAEEPVPKPTDESGGAGRAPSAIDTESRVFFGVRLGYGLPLGKAQDEVDLSQIYSAMIPIWVEAGYLVTPKISLGAFFHYAFMRTALAGCDAPGVSCSGRDLRIGLWGGYHPSRGEALDPWFGFGVGYEIATFSLGSPLGKSDASLKGFELANVQGGMDFELAAAAAIGPFLSLSLGRYSKASSSTQTDELAGKAFHGWLLLGAKSTFSL